MTVRLTRSGDPEPSAIRAQVEETRLATSFLNDQDPVTSCGIAAADLFLWILSSVLDICGARAHGGSSAVQPEQIVIVR